MGGGAANRRMARKGHTGPHGVCPVRVASIVPMRSHDRRGSILGMRITTVGRGTVGGGLAARRRKAGHEVAELGLDGGDASDADAVFVAVPSGVIDDALSKVNGLEGKVVIDATNDSARSAAGTSPSRRSSTR